MAKIRFNKLETINTLIEKTKMSKAWIIRKFLPTLRVSGYIKEYTFKRKKIIYFTEPEKSLTLFQRILETKLSRNPDYSSPIQQ